MKSADDLIKVLLYRAQRISELEAENDQLQQEIAELRKKVAELEEKVADANLVLH